MQSISIQIQPEFLARFDRAAFLAQVRAVGRAPEIDEFTEKGKTYLNYTFFTEFPKALWQDLQQALLSEIDVGFVAGVDCKFEAIDGGFQFGAMERAHFADEGLAVLKQLLEGQVFARVVLKGLQLADGVVELSL